MSTRKSLVQVIDDVILNEIQPGSIESICDFYLANKLTSYLFILLYGILNLLYLYVIQIYSNLYISAG